MNADNPMFFSYPCSSVFIRGYHSLRVFSASRDRVPVWHALESWLLGADPSEKERLLPEGLPPFRLPAYQSFTGQSWPTFFPPVSCYRRQLLRQYEPPFGQ